MKTLPANVTNNYLKRGNSPRIFADVGDASFYIGTQALTIDSKSYVDRIRSGGIISVQVEPFGGMASVSGVSLASLELDGDFYKDRFCTHAEITPVVLGSPRAGSAISTLVGGSYTATRNATTGSPSTASLTVGQKNHVAPPGFSVYRGFLEFTIPAGLTSCEDAYITLNGAVNSSDTDFEIIVLEGEWTAIGATMYRQFDGWALSGTYTGDQLNRTFDSSDYSAGENYIVLNGSAMTLIEAAAGSQAKFMLISSRDYTPTSPSGDEFMRFGSSTATLTIRYNTETLINQVAKIHLAYDDSIPSATASMLRLWTGVVDGYSVGERALSLKLRQNNFKKNKPIPARVITSDNFADAPDDNVNKPYPIVFGSAFGGANGEHKNSIGIEADTGSPSGVRSYFPCTIINKGDGDQNNPMEVLLSTQSVVTIRTGSLSVFSQATQNYARLWGAISGELSGTGYKSVKLYPTLRRENDTTVSLAVEKMFFGTATSIIPGYVYQESLLVADPEEAYDIDGTGGATFTYSGTGGFAIYGFPKISNGGEIDKVEVVFDLTDNRDSTGEMQVLVYKSPDSRVDGLNGVTSYSAPNQTFTSAGADFVSAGVGALDMLQITSGDTNEGRYPIGTVGSPTSDSLTITPELSDLSGQDFVITKDIFGDHIYAATGIQDTQQHIIDVTDYIDWNVGDYLIELRMANADTGNFVVNNLQIRIYSSDAREYTEIYLDKEGREDDASGTVTGTANALIEIPAHVIESIARTDAGYVTAGIDTAAFDTAATSLAAWEFAFQMTERMDVKTLLGELGKQCKSKVYYDNQDRLTMKVTDDSTGFAHSGDDFPAALDIVEEDGSPSSGSMTRHSIKSPIDGFAEFNLSHMSIDAVKNDFVLKYDYDYGLGQYTKTLYMTNGLGTVGDVIDNIDSSLLAVTTITPTANAAGLLILEGLCSDSYTEIESTNTWEFSAWAIRDEATATKLLQYYIERLTKLRAIISFPADENIIEHDVADIINVRHDRLLDRYGTGTMRGKKWEIIKLAHDLDKHFVTVNCIELNYDD